MFYKKNIKYINFIYYKYMYYKFFFRCFNKYSPENIPKFVYLNARDPNKNLKINEAIKKHIQKYNKIEMHESHSSKPFIVTNYAVNKK